MAELPGSFPNDGFFLINRITPFQERVFDKIRLPEEIKIFGSFHEESNDVVLRFPVQNTVVFKGSIPKNGKPVGTPPPLVDQPPSIPPQSKPFIIGRNKPETRTPPPGKPPCRNLFTEGNHTGKIPRRLQKTPTLFHFTLYLPPFSLSQNGYFP
jgi:hypothetical protein